MDNTRGNLEFEILASFYRMWKSTLDNAGKASKQTENDQGSSPAFTSHIYKLLSFPFIFFQFSTEDKLYANGPNGPTVYEENLYN